MSSLFKPLFRYRKYFLAGKILKHCSESYVAIVELDPNLPQTYIEGTLKFYLSSFEGHPPKYTKGEILIAVHVLSNNGHVICHDAPDFYKKTLTPTQAGKEAYHDGYYTAQAFKEIRNITGKISGISLVIWSTIKWGWPLLQRLLQKG